MNDRVAVYVLAGAFLAVLIWRSLPSSAGAAPAADVAASATQGQPTVVPTLPAEFVIGLSLSPDDGGAGPVWYTAQYPGDRPGMPAIPAAIQ